MWMKKFWRPVLIGALLALAMTAVAGAAPNKEKPPKPNPNESVAKSCADNGGTAWVKDVTVNPDGSYVVTTDPEKDYAIPACIDLPPTTGATTWEVELEVDVGNRPRGDVLVRLERAMHDDIYAEEVMPQSVDDLTKGLQTLETTLAAPPTETLVFVAMPANRMNWTVLSVTVRPVP
jgi:hypothetical protein